MAKLDITIGEDAVKQPVIFVRGNNPKEVAEAYLETLHRLEQDKIARKEKGK